MNLQPGQQLLHYRVVEKIGEGGMGVVWKALDTTLDREIAVKFIPEAFAGDSERLARFVREAKMLAALNHPNIAAVYGLHEWEGNHFIAMELVPGEDLAQRLERGPLAVADALDVARQIADALEAAHEQGVIHRDLKPANVKRTPEGKIKVLDLGLAKALAPDPASDGPSVSLSPTVTSAGTVAGTLLGTAAYMSPEQAKGRPADRRADIWAFGVVLHEMLTGRKLFQTETVSETLAAVLRDEVSFDTLPDDVPAPVQRLLARCLDRDAGTRLRDIGEARIALSPAALAAAPAPAGAVAAAAVTEGVSRGRRVLPWLLVAVLAVVAGFALWRAATRPSTGIDALTLVAPFAKDLRIPVDQMGVMAISPDGKYLAAALFGSGVKRLYVRSLDGLEFVPLPGTENASTPFFSPDSRWIGFFADDRLKKVPVSGGTPVTLCVADGNDRGASWGTDDVIVFSPHYVEPLMRVSGAGGDPTPLTTIDRDNGERTHRWPQAVPGEDLVLFTVGTIDSPESYDGARIVAIRPSTGERRTVLERASMARYVPSGHLVFGREGFLFAVPFDVDRLEVLGSPVPVLEGVTGMSASGIVHFGVSDNGLLAYIAGASRSRLARLVLRTRDGTKEPLAAPVDGYVNARVSPDRKQIAAQVTGGSSFDIWTFHIERGTVTRLSFEGDNVSPSWSPDGRRIAFASSRDNATPSAWVKDADGSGQARMICSPKEFEQSGQVIPVGWTPDGKSLLVQFSDRNASNVATCPVDGGEIRVLLNSPASESVPTISPNGRWLAYASDESGAFQVYLREFSEAGGKWQVSSEGGNLPRWSPDGTELFYRDLNDLLVVSVEDKNGSLALGRPRVVFDDLRGSTGESYYDVFDTDRILLVEDVQDDVGPAGVTVRVNWLAELERLAPHR